MTDHSSVYPGYFNLNQEQRRFRNMLLDYPKLLPFWDFESCRCDVSSLQAEMGKLSSDECEMARFFVTMWQPGNVLGFDIMEAVWSLNDDNWKVVRTWMATLEHPGVSKRMMHHERMMHHA